VDYATVDGTATAPTDYNPVSLSTLNFPPGTTSQTISITVNGDVIEEADETFTVDLSNPVNASIADNRGAGTIIDDDAAPTIVIDDVTVAEGNTGTVNAVFTVTLSQASGQLVSVDYATADGTATAPTDYNPVSLSTLNFPPGTTSQTISVTVNGDVIEEADETFTVDLSNPVNASIADNQGAGTITDDDAQGPVTSSFQDGVNGYNGTRDTQLVSGSPNTNYGSDDRMGADGHPDESSLLYWELTSIPVGSSIQSVDLTFNVTGKTRHAYEIYSLQQAWIEGEATWNEHASGQSWEISGADGAADRSSTVIGSITAPARGIYTIPLTTAGVAVVQTWVDNPSSNFGIIILDYINATDGLEISSREAGIVSNRPRLTVTYSNSQNNSARIFNVNEEFDEAETTSQPSPENVPIISNYPNPFSSSTTIEYKLPIDTRIQMSIYNLRGQIVYNLVDEKMTAGNNTIVWYGRDRMGKAVPSGIYLIQLLTEKTRIIKKIILQK
jgi:hypothetical protein